MGLGLGLDGEALAAEAEEGAPEQHTIEPAGAATARARRGLRQRCTGVCGGAQRGGVGRGGVRGGGGECSVAHLHAAAKMA